MYLQMFHLVKFSSHLNIWYMNVECMVYPLFWGGGIPDFSLMQAALGFGSPSLPAL